MSLDSGRAAPYRRRRPGFPVPTGFTEHHAGGRMRRIASFVLGITLFTAAAAAADAVLFNPATFDRDTGQPRNVTRQFRVNYPRGESTLRITNRGVTSATVTLNGRVILGPDDF